VGSLGRRIIVYGPTGSGKSTLARRLGIRLGLGVVEMDALMHGPNWEPTPWDEFREKVTAALDALPEGWVCDGNYSRVREAVLPRADTAIWLHLPWVVCFGRLLGRTVRRAWTRETLWGTNRESWRTAFWSRESILLWSITHHRAHIRAVQRDLARIPHRARVFELRSAHQVRAFLDRLDEKPQRSGE
jgi:adenylate kinase family enzyme